MKIIEQNSKYVIYKDDNNRVIMEEKATFRKFLCHQPHGQEKYRCTGTSIPDSLNDRTRGGDEADDQVLIVDLSDGMKVYPENAQ